MRIIPYQIEMKDALILIWEESSRIAHPFIDESKRAIEKYQIEKFLLDKMTTYVMEDSGEILGFISLAGSVIVGLFVACHLQNQGIGSALIKYVSIHYTRLSVEVFEKNFHAIGFYESLGFKFKYVLENKIYNEKIVFMEREIEIKQ